MPPEAGARPSSSTPNLQQNLSQNRLAAAAAAAAATMAAVRVGEAAAGQEGLRGDGPHREIAEAFRGIHLYR